MSEVKSPQGEENEVSLVVDPEPEIVSASKRYKPKSCKGCGESFTPAAANQQNCAACMPLKETYNATRQKESRAARKTEAKADTASRTPKSIVEVKPKEAAAILAERGLRHPHVIEFCVQLAQTAARIHHIPLNHYLFANGLRATLEKTKLAEIADEEVEGECLLHPERVDERRRHVRQEHHVGLVDLLEAADRRAVEREAVAEHGLVERLNRHVEVLHDAGQVAEPDVDEPHLVVPDVAQDLVWAIEHPSSGRSDRYGDGRAAALLRYVP